MQFIIRKCKDLKLIDKLKHQCFDKDSIVDDLRTSTWWVAWCSGHPAGYCGIQQWPDGTAFLNMVGVLESYRGFGLQKRMIKIRESYAKQRGTDIIYTYTAPFNAASMRSLITCGYRPYESPTEWAGEEFVYWSRKLS